MADFPTFNDLFRIARDEVLTRNSDLTREIVEREGSDANALTAAGVAVGDAVVGQLISVQAALYIATAKGTDLDRLVFDRYQLVRKAASPAVGEVSFTTPAPAPAGFSIPIGTQLETSDGIQFVTIEQATFLGGTSGPVPVAVKSVLSGLSQQARIGTITSVVSAIPGVAPNLQVTNLLATAGADDEETDDSLRDRAKRFYTTSKRGTLAAIEAGALAVPGVREATAFEALTGTGDPARLVSLIIADAFTEQLVDSLVVPPSYQVQSQALANTVRTALLDVRAGGIQVIIQLGIVELLGITLALRFRAGSDDRAAAAAAKGVIVSYMNSLPPGASFIVADAELALKRVPGLVVLGGEIVSPAGDVLATALQVLRTNMSLVVIGSGTTAQAA